MELHDLRPAEGSRKGRKRVGRGTGSGLGTTSGRGNKGQKSRSGHNIPKGFEGGQMPLHRRLPKFGFNNKRFAKVYAEINLTILNVKFQAGDVVNKETLVAVGLIPASTKRVKVLGNGELDKKLTISVDKVSAGAKAKIEAAGGTVG